MIKLKFIPSFLQLLSNKPSFFKSNYSSLLRYFINQSKFFTPRVSVQQLLNQNQIEYRASASNVLRLKYCPFCKKPHHEDLTNLYTLNVNKQHGLFFCHRCNSKGSYLELKKAILGISIDTIASEFQPNKNEVQKQIVSESEYFIYKQNIKKQEYRDVRLYLNSRGLNHQIIQKYNIGSGYEVFNDSDGQTISVKVIYFPMYRFLSPEQQKKKLLFFAELGQQPKNHLTQIAKIKIRGVGKQNKKYMRQYPSGPGKGLFGLNTVKKQDKVVVLTEGQFDAMSVHQMTGIPALSLPQGANSLPDVVLPYLDQFQKVILWMDNDEAGKLNIEKFAQKLGISRTHIVLNQSKQLKDANDFLQKKPEMIQQMIQKARTIPDQNIIKFDEIRDKIRERFLNDRLFQGVQLSTFSFFNKKVKGIRTGELSVVSGGTGSGKTTLLSQFSIDLSQKKIPVLWGSFEIRNQILISNMLSQFSEVNLKKNIHRFDEVADKFKQLPLYYMSFHGSHDVNKVLGTITFAIESYGITFVVIDTLQFFLSGQAEGSKKFDMQDYVMSELRKIATLYKVHIAVVIHPRKTDDNEDIGIHSIYGTSKATQEADNVWIIQNRDGFKIFDIKKNRYDGDVGRVAIGFNKNNKSFFELKKKQLESIFNKQKTVHDILQDREAQKLQKQKEQMGLFILDQFSQGDEPELNRRKKY